MNADTIRGVAEIKQRGWFPKHQTLGEGGWGELHPLIDSWRKYLLFSSDQQEPLDEITARDDETAIAVFKGEFNWDAGFVVFEKIVKYREVEL